MFVIQFAMHGMNNTKVNDLCYEIWNSHSGAALNPNLPQCYTVPTGKQPPMFRRIAVPSSSWPRSPFLYWYHSPKHLNPDLRVCSYNSLTYWKPLPKSSCSVSVSKCTLHMTLSQLRVPCSLLLLSYTHLFCYLSGCQKQINTIKRGMKFGTNNSSRCAIH